jgi:ferritin-like metal-binding protein YciE
MHSRTEQLVTWLDDAHAMESGLIGILENHASHAADISPQSSRRLQQHAVETQQHVQRLTECLGLLNATPSGVKSTLSALTGAVEGVTTAIFRDTVVKDALMDYASEQFEVACYTALTNAATELGHPEVARLCRLNLEEDRAMADWLLQQIPAVVSVELHHTVPARARS